ncbi:hypothetical protein [Terrarubrum flagellatum]|uniref:hypothetical protein n=1 Tax=Terrirubrum flagellatum TaxID=2895980 RepID=UPI0031450F63
MWTYRRHLRDINRVLAEEYIGQHAQHVSAAFEKLAEAVPVALAIAQLHGTIRHSPARNFWPVIRETKGMLLIRSTDTGQECPWPWKPTKRGNMRYELPGRLLFSPWPPNFRRMLHSALIELQQVMDNIQTLASKSDASVTHLPYSISRATQRAERLIPEIKAFQEFAMPASVAALDRWSRESRRSSNIVLRILQGTLVYNDGPDRCEIKLPNALTSPLLEPSTPDRALELHLVRAGAQSYYP